MIVEAERMSKAQQNKSYRKRCHNDKNVKDTSKISSSRIRKYSRSRSRSRSRDRDRKYNTPNYSSQHRTELKQTYCKSKDNDYQQTMPTSSCIKNWKKTKNDGKRCQVTELPAFEPEEIDLGNINSTNEMDEDKGILTETEMNKLGARIIKAELMGDDVCLLLY